MKNPRWIGRLAVAFVSAAIALGGAEGLCRIADQLVVSASADHPLGDSGAEIESVARSYAAAVPRADGIDWSWYDESPGPQTPLPDPAWIAERLRRHTWNYETLFEFNIRFLRDRICRALPASTLGSLDDFLYFEPLEATMYPTYRHLRHISPRGWFVTDNFGWRGPDIALRKPERTIRIAFVGASTTIGQYALPFSYPELIAHWLSRWAERRHADLRFEVINAARTGIDSHSIAAIVHQELLPVEPDLVVYYEGANQFQPMREIGYRFGRMYPAPQPRARALPLATRSALVRRVSRVADRVLGRDGGEPLKPVQWIRWGVGVDERAPDPHNPNLPVDLPSIVRDLTSIDRDLKGIGGQLVLSTFVWMVKDGLTLDLRRDRNLYEYLNRSYWPASYRTIRRLADVQNEVLRRFAVENAVPLVDVAGRFPLEPRVFGDAIHLRTPGVRLQGWIALQALVPIIEQRVADGRLPRPARNAALVHPAFDQPSPRFITRQQIQADCGTARLDRR